MSDEDLRALERAVLTGDVAARLRLAAEYERLGRRDDAIGVLLPGWADLEVRRALGALPCWSDREGAIDSPRALDAPSPAHAPEVAWVHAARLEEPAKSDGTDWDLLASPLGIALCGRFAPPYLLDALTGERRGHFAGRMFWPEAIVQDVVVVGGIGHRAWTVDLTTGATLHETTFPGHWTLHGGLFVTQATRKVHGVERSTTHGWRLADTRRPPVKTWRREGKGGLRRAGQRLALMSMDFKAHVIDPATGEDRFVVPGECYTLDDDGVVGRAGDHMVLWDPDGREVWRRPAGLAVLALGRDLVLLCTPRARDEVHGEARDVPLLLALDRATGRERWRCGPIEDMRTFSTVVVRDAVYVLADEVYHALDAATGAVRWRVDLRALDLAGTEAISPLSRRFYGVAPGGRVFCLRAS